MFLNTVFLVYGVIIDYKEGKHTKAIKAAKLEYEEAMKVMKAKMEEIELRKSQQRNN